MLAAPGSLRRRAFDVLPLRPRETLRQFLRNKAGGRHHIAAEKGVLQSRQFRRRPHRPRQAVNLPERITADPQTSVP